MPKSEASRLWAHQLQLTVADWLYETGQTHHPVANVLYYEEQTAEAKKHAEYFIANRIPKFLGYFEGVLSRNPSGEPSPSAAGVVVDLSLFQMIEGFRYAFPRTLANENQYPAVRDPARSRLARPRIAAYASPRRLPFNEQGIFRRYPELED